MRPLPSSNGRVDGVDVVTHFAPIVALLWPDLIFIHQGFVDAGLCAFNLAGGLRLLDHVHLNEEVYVRHNQGEGVQLSKSSGRP